MLNCLNKQVVAGQPSYCLETPQVELALTERGGMLGPVTFYRDSRPIQPYSVAPWAEEPLAEDTPSLLRTLRGDFICSTFGGNAEPFEGRTLPPHGETANDPWELVSCEQNPGGCDLVLEMPLRARGGRCRMWTALRAGDNFVYQRHDFTGVDGPLNPGHHAIVQFPDAEGSGRLAFSRFVHAHTYVQPFERPVDRGYSFFKPDQPIEDLRRVPCIDGSTTDVTRYPARRGWDDLLILCADPALDVAWTSVTFPAEGYVWLALRDPRLLPATVLWMSNGGRHYAPWNGRHLNTMGLEDTIGYFHEGLTPSARPNFLNDLGIRTCHQLTPEQTLAVPYIQGVVRVPEGFDVLAEVVPEGDAVRLIAASGVEATAPCRVGFLRSGQLEG